MQRSWVQSSVQKEKKKGKETVPALKGAVTLPSCCMSLIHCLTFFQHRSKIQTIQCQTSGWSTFPRCVKQQEITYNQDKTSQQKAGPEVTEIMPSADKDLKTVVTAVKINPTPNLIGLISEFRKVEIYKIHMQTSVEFLYIILNIKLQKCTEAQQNGGWYNYEVKDRGTQVKGFKISIKWKESFQGGLV